MTPKLSCDSKGTTVTGTPIGYFLPHPQTISFSSTFKSPAGATLAGSGCATPPFSHTDLGDNVERWLPSCTILASSIDDRAPAFSSVYDSTVTIVMGGELQFTASTGSGGGSFGTYRYFIGLGTGGVPLTQHNISIDKIGGTTPEGNQLISINRLTRASDGADLLGLQNKINSLEPDILESSVRVEALLNQFRDVNTNEAFPSARIFECLDSTCNTNRAVSSSQRLVQISSTSDIFRGNVQVPQGAIAGHYAVEVTSPDRNTKSIKRFHG